MGIFPENKDSYYDLTNSSLNYKKMGTLSSVLDMLRYQDIFCVKYNLNESCTRCNYKNESLNYLKPYFTISEIELNKNLPL